ncbi:hypothetical protein GOP47_0015076 [Adiantum capillus-veneris]|uniref:Uncharacterized protein n=1 Tax=Adiantum capillus-veneris TaxID=13818 RepID=A0A9D4ZCR6_ADICA|nr:hypothetical protein GOP47_0015076 [Adiantum capillus-veneris]
MDASADSNNSSPSPSPPELQSQHQDAADRARETLLAISQADAGSNLQDIAKPIIGEKGVSKEGCPSALQPGKEPTDEDEVFRKKLISISYEGPSLPVSESCYSNGSYVASPPPRDGHGCPPC